MQLTQVQWGCHHPAPFAAPPMARGVRARRPQAGQNREKKGKLVGNWILWGLDRLGVRWRGGGKTTAPTLVPHEQNSPFGRVTVVRGERRVCLGKIDRNFGCHGRRERFGGEPHAGVTGVSPLIVRSGCPYRRNHGVGPPVAVPSPPQTSPDGEISDQRTPCLFLRETSAFDQRAAPRLNPKPGAGRSAHLSSPVAPLRFVAWKPPAFCRCPPPSIWRSRRRVR